MEYDACDQCKLYGSKIYSAKEIELCGFYPPFHPNCRCRVVEAITRETPQELIDAYHSDLFVISDDIYWELLRKDSIMLNYFGKPVYFTNFENALIHNGRLIICKAYLERMGIIPEMIGTLFEVPKEGKTPGADAPPSLPKEGRDGLLFRDDPLARPEMMTVLDDGSGGFEQATGYYANRYTAREISFMFSMVEGGFTPEESLALLNYMNEQSAGPLMTPNLSATELRQILPDTDFTITRRGVDEAVNAAALVRLSYQVAMFHMTLADAETNLQKQRSAEQQALLNFVVYSAALNALYDPIQQKPTDPKTLSEWLEATGVGFETKHGSQTAYQGSSQTVYQGPDTIRTVVFRGTTMIQDDNLFDPHFIGPDGLTNLQKMQNGNAPIGYDGMSIHIHHIDQTHTGSVMEIPASVHHQLYSKIHTNTGQFPSQINRGIAGSWRKYYWESRARDFLR
jgi:hypothetical protein